MLEATLRAYVEEVGVDHAGGLERCVGGNVTMADVVGPGLTLADGVPDGSRGVRQPGVRR